MEIKKSTSVKEKILTTLFLVVSMFGLSAIVPYLKIRLLTQFFPLIYACICCYYLMKYIVNKYTYTFSDNTLLIEKTTGRNESVLLSLYLSKIVSVEKNGKKGSCLTVSPVCKDYLSLTYLEGKKEKTVKIHCDEELTYAFIKKVGDKFHE